MSLQQWQQFLQESALKNPVGSIAQVSQDDTAICDLSHLGLLQLEGADAMAFLQGQVTNDVKQLDGHRAHYTGYCNPKGRLLALFLAFSHGDLIHLQLPKALIEPIAKRLKMYVLRSKVEIKDASESMIKIGLSGRNAAALLSTVFTAVPQNIHELVTLDSATLIKLPGDNPRFEILSDITHAPAIWNALSQQAKPADAQYWEWQEIQAGIPQVYPHTQEEFVPQMLNLDLIDGINFKKGCYTGQEIVARTHYLGTVKRRTHLAHVDASKQPEAGHDILNSRQEPVGKVVRCAPAPNDGFDLLAEVRLESITETPLFIDNTPLAIKQLPYAL